MSMEIIKLAECCISISDGDHQPPPKADTGIPFITISNFIDNEINFSGCMFVPGDYYNSLAKNRRATKGDILYSVVGSFGIPILLKDSNPFVFQRHIAILKPNNKKVLPEYLYYILKTPSFYKVADAYAVGTAQRTIGLNSLRRIKVMLPTIDEQKSVVEKLKPYDLIIENNNKRIKILEQMAENLYKEWFVRFRFPGYEDVEFEGGMPKGWERVKLKEITRDAGKSVKKEKRDCYQHYLPIDCLPQHRMALSEEDTIDNAESSLVSFKTKNILFGAMRPYFHKVVLAPFDGLTRSTCFVINSVEETYIYYLYLLLYQVSTVDYANTISVGSTMPYVRWDDFMRMNTVKPDIQIIKSFNQIIIPIIDSIMSYSEANKKILKQRDLLLPHLMSGKHEVK